MSATAKSGKYSYQLVGALLWQARLEFLKAIAQQPKIKFCSELKALLPLYKQSVAEHKSAGIRFEHRYEKDTYPLKLRAAIDQCVERNGYLDSWVKSAAAETLHVWSADQDSANTNEMFLASGVFANLSEGVLPPFVFRATEWSG